jgi:hypothetical protein
MYSVPQALVDNAQLWHIGDDAFGFVPRACHAFACLRVAQVRLLVPDQ